MKLLEELQALREDHEASAAEAAAERQALEDRLAHELSVRMEQVKQEASELAKLKAEQDSKMMELGTHSLTYSLTHSLTYSLTHLLTHSLTHSIPSNTK